VTFKVLKNYPGWSLTLLPLNANLMSDSINPLNFIDTFWLVFQMFLIKKKVLKQKLGYRTKFSTNLFTRWETPLFTIWITISRNSHPWDVFFFRREIQIPLVIILVFGPQLENFRLFGPHDNKNLKNSGTVKEWGEGIEKNLQRKLMNAPCWQSKDEN
jgi:hypothetical protein